jgi:hypothetical protein
VKAYLYEHGMSVAANNVARWLGVWYVSRRKKHDPMAPRGLRKERWRL